MFPCPTVAAALDLIAGWGPAKHLAQQEGVTLLGRAASLCRSVARARAPITERQLAPTRRLDTSVRTRYRVSQSLQTHTACVTGAT